MSKSDGNCKDYKNILLYGHLWANMAIYGSGSKAIAVAKPWFSTFSCKKNMSKYGKKHIWRHWHVQNARVHTYVSKYLSMYMIYIYIFTYNEYTPPSQCMLRTMKYHPFEICWQRQEHGPINEHRNTCGGRTSAVWRDALGTTDGLVTLLLEAGFQQMSQVVLRRCWRLSLEVFPESSQSNVFV